MAEGNDVKLYVYDLSQGLASQLSLPLLGKKIDGIWHTGVVVYGTEYFFGSMGVCDCPPGGTIMGQPHQILNLGSTYIPKELFQEFLVEVGSSTFQGIKYHLLEHNCNNFSNEVCQFLVGRTIPAHITGLPAEVLATPFGAVIRPFLESMSVQPSAGAGLEQSAGAAEPYVAPTSSGSSAPASRPQATSSESSSPDAASRTRHSAASSRALSAVTGGKHEMYSWTAPLVLFESEQYQPPSSRQNNGQFNSARQAADFCPRFVMPPSLEDSLFLGTMSDHLSGNSPPEALDCVRSLQEMMNGYVREWLRKARVYGLDVKDDELPHRLSSSIPSSDAGCLDSVALLSFSLTTAMGELDQQHGKLAQLVLQFLSSTWPKWKSTEFRDMRVSVLYLLAWLSTHSLWLGHMLMETEWESSTGKKVSNAQLVLSILVDGLLDEHPTAQQLALRCINNVCLRITSESAALEYGAALLEFLLEPRRDLSEVAFLAMLRCLAVNEEELSVIMSMTRIPEETYAIITSPELKEVVRYVRDLFAE
eukprot:scpid67998/ scgid23990/ Desumoylating isopeptidase 1; PPPDE peptidase domain-containing protein 2; Protein FAM152B